MKKQFFVGLFLTFNFLLLTCLYARWPINMTPKITGTITDVTTGKPIENVVVSAEWVKSSPSFGGDVSKTFHRYITVTDRDGKYKIPSHRSFHMYSLIPVLINGSAFEYLGIGILHPLYETAGFNVGELDRRDLRKEHKQYDGKYGIMISTGGPSGSPFYYDLYVEEKGIIHYDVKLLSLEERYKDIKNLTEEDKELISKYRELKRKHATRFVSNLEKKEIIKIEEDFNEFMNKNKRIEKTVELIYSFENFLEGQIRKPEFWMWLKKKYGIRYDIDYILEKWDELYQILYGKKLDLGKFIGVYDEPVGETSLKKEIEKIKAEGY